MISQKSEVFQDRIVRTGRPCPNCGSALYGYFELSEVTGYFWGFLTRRLVYDCTVYECLSCGWKSE